MAPPWAQASAHTGVAKTAERGAKGQFTNNVENNLIFNTLSQENKRITTEPAVGSDTMG